MKLGVFVGSSNPVHKGRIPIVNALLEGRYVDKVIMIATGNYWNKTNIIDLEDRINMLSIFQSENLIIDKEFNDLQYTYQIMDALKKKYPNDELALIIGSDNIVSFDKWVNYQDLLKLRLIICQRGDIDTEYYLKKLNKVDNYDIVDISNDGSSTLARENMNNIDNLKKYLDDRVIKYIFEHNLYK